MRGEQTVGTVVYFTAKGSPPLARGTVLKQLYDYGDGGITPACAGNRARARNKKLPQRDHPRLRGEQIFLSVLPVRRMGSPPLARGTVVAKR